MVAQVLGVPSHAVTVEIRRMGGGFGGKETQGNLFACVCAMVAKKTGRAAKVRPDRDDDMVITGKRHDFVVDYEVGFDDDGRIHGRRHDLRRPLRLVRRSVRPGHRPGAVPRRQLLLLPAVELRSLPLKTNTVSNTAFRGFGGPQGMVGGERVHRGGRLRARATTRWRSASCNFYGVASATSRPTTRRSRTMSSTSSWPSWRPSADYAARRAGGPRLQRDEPGPQARASR